MRARSSCTLLLTATALGLLACGSGLRSATHYGGRSERQLVSQAQQVQDASVLPVGYESLGEVSARCRITDGQRAFAGAWLSDVDCGEERLTRALRERAAAEGGVLLVGRDCGSRIHRRAGGEYDVRCRAEVARPSPEALQLGTIGAVPGQTSQVLDHDDRPPASEAWRIRVDFEPVASVAPRLPRRTDHVNELPRLPPSHVRFGDVVTRCEGGCTERAVREGLLTVAGRAGATDVVDVRCVTRGSGFLCTGTAAGYEVDPQRERRAR